MKKKDFSIIVLVALLLSLHLAIAADVGTGEDVLVGKGFDLGQLLNFGSGLLALVLFAMTVTAFKRSKNKRLIPVSMAFILFSINGFLISSQLFFGDWAWIDPFTSVVNFAILVCFFFGILK